MEKNALFDAVIGVVGVFASCRAGGGDKFLSDELCSWSAAILAVVGVLNGPSVMGGNLKGWSVFLDCCAAGGLVSISNLDVCTDLRLLGLRWSLTGGPSLKAPDMLPVDVL